MASPVIYFGGSPAIDLVGSPVNLVCARHHTQTGALLPTYVLGKIVRPFAIIFLVDCSMTTVVRLAQLPVVCQEEGVFLGN